MPTNEDWPIGGERPWHEEPELARLESERCRYHPHRACAWPSKCDDSGCLHDHAAHRYPSDD